MIACLNFFIQLKTNSIYVKIHLSTCKCEYIERKRIMVHPPKNPKLIKNIEQKTTYFDIVCVHPYSFWSG